MQARQQEIETTADSAEPYQHILPHYHQLGKLRLLLLLPLLLLGREMTLLMIVPSWIQSLLLFLSMPSMTSLQHVFVRHLAVYLVSRRCQQREHEHELS